MNEQIRALAWSASETGISQARAAEILVESEHAGQAVALSVAAAEEFGKAVALWSCLLAAWEEPNWLKQHGHKARLASFALGALNYPDGALFDFDWSSVEGVAAFFANLIREPDSSEFLTEEKITASAVFIDNEPPHLDSRRAAFFPRRCPRRSTARPSLHYLGWRRCDRLVPALHDSGSGP